MKQPPDLEVIRGIRACTVLVKQPPDLEVICGIRACTVLVKQPPDLEVMKQSETGPRPRGNMRYTSLYSLSETGPSETGPRPRGNTRYTSLYSLWLEPNSFRCDSHSLLAPPLCKLFRCPWLLQTGQMALME